MGDGIDFRETAKLLDEPDGIVAGIIASRSLHSPKTVEQWVADNKSFTAEEAKNARLVERISEAKAGKRGPKGWLADSWFRNRTRQLEELGYVHQTLKMLDDLMDAPN